MNAAFFKPGFKSKRGFTLIELIVVIAIIAILATLLIPSLTGFINNAAEIAVMSECRQIVTAVQSVSVLNFPEVTAANLMTTYWDDVNSLCTVPPGATIDNIAMAGGNLSRLRYTNKNISVLYENGGYIVNGVPGPAPTPAPTSAPAPTMNGFTKILNSGLTGDEKLSAIAENAKLLVAFVNSEVLNTAGSLAQGAAYWNKTQMDPCSNLNGCTLMDKDGKVLVSNVTMTYGDSVKAEFDRLGIDTGTIRFYFETLTVGGRTVRTLTPAYITFKSKALTGGTSAASEYIYTPSTGVLELKAP